MKTRFAPSPTGLIHLGNARTALFSALFSRAQQGTFLLRIEDTDQVRSSTEFLLKLIEDLHWLGIIWEEGEAVGGAYAPYRQSQRNEIYNRYYQQLLDAGYAYPCYCTEEELGLERTLQKKLGKPPRYSGKCAGNSLEQCLLQDEKGLKSSLRFRVKKGQTVHFRDAVKGDQNYQTDDLGDFIIRRQDGSATFMFCNAIDDSLMGVTHVLRGEDHLSNTPRQLIILRALNLREPEYAHMALINGVDGAPLSKRNGSRSIDDLKNIGFLPIAVVNYMARLGHYYEDHQLLSYQDLALRFSLGNLGSKAARFDEGQLLHWQKMALHQLSMAEFSEWAVGSRLNDLQETQRHLFIQTIRENVLLKKEVERYVALLLNHEFSPQFYPEILVEAGEAFFDFTLASLKAESFSYQHLIEALAEHFNIKGKALFMPLRVALTGELHGPSLEAIFELLGKTEMIRRITLVKALFS